MDRSGPDRALRLRFAVVPARTLDVGAARTALFNWLLARNAGGRFILRSDDLGAAPDREPGERAVARDLRWLGLDWDEGPDTGGPVAPYRQSERGALYDEHVGRLSASGATYERDGAVWFRVPPGTTAVHDLVKGDVVFGHDAIADFVVRTPTGIASPALAAAVDDATMCIDLVLQSDDRLDLALRQMLLARALDCEPPRFAHVGSIRDAPRRDDGGHTEAGIDDLRRMGFLPVALVEHLALLGWSPPDGRESFSLDELAGLFSLERAGGSPSHFDLDRLRAFNARALRALPRERFHALVAEWMQRARLLEDPVPAAADRWIETFLDAFGGEVHTLGEALAVAAALRAESTIVPALELERLRNRQVLFFLDAVSQYVDDQPELRGLPLANDLPAIAGEFGIARKDAFAAVRMALTGTHDGPPLALLFPLLGHDRIMMRIGAVNSHILHGRGLEPIRFGPGGVPFETIQPELPQATGHGRDGS